MNYRYYTLIVFTALGLLGCQYHSASSPQSKKSTGTVVIVKRKVLHKQLTYLGKIVPKVDSNIISPVAGYIAKQHVPYGQYVKKGTLLFTIHSRHLYEQFSQALITYLKTKNQLRSQQDEVKVNQLLLASGGIAKEEYENKKNALEDTQIQLYQAVRNLAANAKLMGFDKDAILNLSLKNIDMIKNMLKAQATLQIKAPASGYLLKPKAQSQSSSGNDSVSELREGQVVASISELKTIFIKMRINEVDINQIHPGQAVQVTGPGFPGVLLKGHIVEQPFMADISNENQASQVDFPIDATVDALTDAQQKVVHMGMSAKTRINLVSKSALVVPIQAVFDFKGLPAVKRLNSKGQSEAMPVIIGEASDDEIVIKKGLKAGDHIMIDD